MDHDEEVPPEQSQKRKFRKMPVDAHAILRDGLAGIADLPRLMGSANIEERKLVMQAFIAGIAVDPTRRASTCS